MFAHIEGHRWLSWTQRSLLPPALPSAEAGSPPFFFLCLFKCNFVFWFVFGLTLKHFRAALVQPPHGQLSAVVSCCRAGNISGSAPAGTREWVAAAAAYFRLRILLPFSPFLCSRIISRIPQLVAVLYLSWSFLTLLLSFENY